MTIKQSLSDKEKENKENDRRITHFQDSHDKLSLEDIVSDDEEDGEEGEEGGEGTPSTELHVYTIPELMKFKKDELVAETVYIEGK